MLIEITTEVANHTSAVNFVLLFVKMIAALIVACTAAVLVLKYVVPKLGFSKRFQQDQNIKILSRITLGPKQYLSLVRVYKKCILLGVTDHSVNKIAEVEDSEIAR